MRVISILILSLLSSGQVFALDAPTMDSADLHLRWTRSLKRPLGIDSEALKDVTVPGLTKDRELLAIVPELVADVAISGGDQVPRKWSVLISDKTLYRTMRRWAQEANYQLLWQIDRDYPIEANVTFESNLKDAVGQIMAGVALTDYPIQAIFNPASRVLRVARYMDEGRR